MTVNKSMIADFADELRIAVLTGGFDVIGTLDFNPVQIIFDNQSSVDIGISKNGSSIWHTFPAGEAIILDMRGNHGIADNFSFPVGTTFYAQGAAGANAFSISYTYALDL